MSIQPLIFKNGVITAPRSPTDIADINTILGITAALNLKANLISPNLSGTPTTTTASAGTNTNQIASCAFVTTAVSAISTSNFVDLTSNQTINGTKIFSGNLQLPNNSGISAGMLWRSGNNLEYRDGANVTKILLNSAGNLSNLMDKQVALNNLVNGQVANRVLRSDGTNVTLSQVNLSTDTTGNLPISLGGTGSSTQNFIDLTTNQSIAGIKTFSSGIILPNVAGTLVGGIWRNVDNLEYKDSSNVTKIILNSAGNLSNLANKQTALNNLVGTQTPNRILRSDGTNVVLSQVALDTDVTNILSTTNGGTGSSTQNFVDLTTNQNVAGTKIFTDATESTSTTTGGNRFLGGVGIAKNLSVGGRIIQAINHKFKAAASTTQVIPNATFTKINLNSEIVDSNNQYNPTLSRLTAITTEVWQLTLYITLRLTTTSRILLSVFKNGAEVGGTSRIMDVSVSTGATVDYGTILNIPEFPLIASDYLEVYCYASPSVTVFGESSLIAVFWSGKRVD